ncbi:hypothetical protein R6Q57_026546 [Mikania cordata]
MGGGDLFCGSDREDRDGSSGVADRLSERRSGGVAAAGAMRPRRSTAGAVGGGEEEEADGGGEGGRLEAVEMQMRAVEHRVHRTTELMVASEHRRKQTTLANLSRNPSFFFNDPFHPL